MFLLPTLSIAQVATVAKPQEVVKLQEVRVLPGQLDQFPVFNSNSPERVGSEGILLSTFPSKGKKVPTAHLNYLFNGRFDLFAHHVSKAASTKDKRPLYIGILLHNPSKEPIKVLVLQATSYLSHTQAPFIQLPSQVANPTGKIYAGPGSRVMTEVLRRDVQSNWPVSLVLPAQSSHMLVNLPIPTSPVSGRTTWIRLSSSGGLYAASMALYARKTWSGKLRAPLLEEWKALLKNAGLVTPRDRTPTPLDAKTEKFVYGRVAGVSQGSQWQGTATDTPDVSYLSIPQQGQAFSYGINTLDRGTLGTGQVQSARMLVRYPDTAYRAHGNYGVKYSLTLPLFNPTSQPQKVTLALQTPLKEDQLTKKGLRFLNPPAKQVFFRGTVQLRYTDKNKVQTQYVHLVQHRGQQGKPLLTLDLLPKQTRSVNVDFLYPPDSTPPQVLTVQTLSQNNSQRAAHPSQSQ